MCTYNRKKLLERAIGCFLLQEGENVLVIYNTGSPYVYEHPRVILVNNSLDYLTGLPYQNVGAKHRDAYTHCPPYDVITHMCDDDMFLPEHMGAGVAGLLSCKLAAYKPKESWYMYSPTQAILQENVMEPSIFISSSEMITYQMNSVCYHNGWLYPLIERQQLYTDPNGKSTFIYDWSGASPVYKLSGRGVDDNNNFIDSQAFGDSIGGQLIPLTYEQLLPYYSLTYKVK